MGTLERMGLIKQERRKVEGMRGRGRAVYYINSHVACNGSLEIGQAAQETIKSDDSTVLSTSS